MINKKEPVLRKEEMRMVPQMLHQNVSCPCFGANTRAELHEPHYEDRSETQTGISVIQSHCRHFYTTHRQFNGNNAQSFVCPMKDTSAPSHHTTLKTEKCLEIEEQIFSVYEPYSLYPYEVKKSVSKSPSPIRIVSSDTVISGKPSSLYCLSNGMRNLDGFELISCLCQFVPPECSNLHQSEIPAGVANIASGAAATRTSSDTGDNILNSVVSPTDAKPLNFRSNLCGKPCQCHPVGPHACKNSPVFNPLCFCSVCPWCSKYRTTYCYRYGPYVPCGKCASCVGSCACRGLKAPRYSCPPMRCRYTRLHGPCGLSRCGPCSPCCGTRCGPCGSCGCRPCVNVCVPKRSGPGPYGFCGGGGGCVGCGASKATVCYTPCRGGCCCGRCGYSVSPCRTCCNPLFRTCFSTASKTAYGFINPRRPTFRITKTKDKTSPNKTKNIVKIKPDVKLPPLTPKLIGATIDTNKPISILKPLPYNRSATHNKSCASKPPGTFVPTR